MTLEESLVALTAGEAGAGATLIDSQGSVIAAAGGASADAAVVAQVQLRQLQRALTASFRAALRSVRLEGSRRHLDLRPLGEDCLLVISRSSGPAAHDWHSAIEKASVELESALYP